MLPLGLVHHWMVFHKNWFSWVPYFLGLPDPIGLFMLFMDADPRSTVVFTTKYVPFFGCHSIGKPLKIDEKSRI